MARSVVAAFMACLLLSCASSGTGTAAAVGGVGGGAGAAAGAGGDGTGVVGGTGNGAGGTSGNGAGGVTNMAGTAGHAGTISDRIPNSIDLVVSDMQGSHEGTLSGVPLSVGWAEKPRVGMGNEMPDGWSAMTAWGQIYRDADGNPSVNSRVAIRNIRSFVLRVSDGQWHELQRSTGVDGAAYVEDFSGDQNIPPDARTEPDGSTAVKLTEGYNYHFWPAWPSGRVTLDGSDIAGLYVAFDARLVVDDPDGPDDRAVARILGGVGGDFWESLSAKWDNWTTNGDFVIGKMKYVEAVWKTFNAHTLKEDQIRANPPPLE